MIESFEDAARFPPEERDPVMRDPLSWSFPIGRLFGVTVRVHVLFPLVALGLIIRAAAGTKAAPALEGDWIDATLIIGFLFFSILLHEFGHCFGARAVNGDASEVLLWPLGGLAYCDVPHTPRANFICTAAGPAVNLLLCALRPGPVPHPDTSRCHPGVGAAALEPLDVLSVSVQSNRVQG